MLTFALLAAAAHLRTLSDRDVAAIAASRFDAAAKMEQTEVLGLHHGMKLVADYPCSDLCPAYTVRIIHYDHPPGPSCDAAGGTTRSERVPVSIAMMNRNYCEPRAIAGHKP